MAQKGVVQFRIVPCPNCQDGSSTECGYYGPGSSGHSTTDASLPYDGLCEGWGKLLICYECMQIGQCNFFGDNTVQCRYCKQKFPMK